MDIEFFKSYNKYLFENGFTEADKFKNENIDILIGTQMVVKGHHFPNVTLVGVIAADASLNMGDYRANEKTCKSFCFILYLYS